MWPAQSGKTGELFSQACAGVCSAAGSPACLGSSQSDGSLEVFLKCRHLKSDVCLGEVSPGWMVCFRCLNLHVCSYLKVSCHLLAANPSGCGFPAHIVPHVPAPCGCFGYTAPAASALPLGSGEVVPDKNNPLLKFPFCISRLCLVQPALNPAKAVHRSVCTSQANSCWLLAFPSCTMVVVSFSRWSRCKWVLGEVEGLRKAQMDE